MNYLHVVQLKAISVYIGLVIEVVLHVKENCLVLSDFTPGLISNPNYMYR